jgi:hypothetical protein
MLKGILARTQAERALHESDARLRRSEHHLKHAERLANTGSIERDFATGASVWSDELFRILGVGIDFPRSFESFLTLVNKDDRATLAATMRAVADMKPGENFCGSARRRTSYFPAQN